MAASADEALLAGSHWSASGARILLAITSVVSPVGCSAADSSAHLIDAEPSRADTEPVSPLAQRSQQDEHDVGVRSRRTARPVPGRACRTANMGHVTSNVLPGRGPLVATGLGGVTERHICDGSRERGTDAHQDNRCADAAENRSDERHAAAARYVASHPHRQCDTLTDPWDRHMSPSWR